MTFEGQYLTYAEYTSLIQNMGGSAIDQMPFNLLEYECRRQIDVRTQNRLKQVSDIPQEVKLCEFKMINVMSKYDQTLDSIANNGNIASENIDGYSVSYITNEQANKIIETRSAELDSIIEKYLMNVIVNNQHIMYLGVK